MLEERRDLIRMEPRRAAVFDAVRSVVDQLVMLKLSQGDTVAALRYIDHARASLAPAGRAHARTLARGLSPRSRTGEIIVEYGVIGETVLIWTVDGRRVRLARMQIDTIRLARAIETVTAQMERHATSADVRPGLTYLYDALMRPVAGQLGGAGSRVALIVDGVLANVPFAALYDSVDNRFVVEKHAIRYSVSLQAAALRAPSLAAPRAVFVTDPEFDPSEHPLLERLPRARVEVRAIASLYPGAPIIDGPEATPAAFLAALTRADVIHFGGHAVFDDTRPELSYLLLARTSGRTHPDVLTAAALSRLDLYHVRLVVLAACRTVRGGRNRAGGYSGLAGALLAAGAGGTVATTWQIDDRLTGMLIPAFYRAYNATSDAPESLRAAQLQLLHSNDWELRSPAAWAGFRYTGA